MFSASFHLLWLNSMKIMILTSAQCRNNGFIIKPCMTQSQIKMQYTKDTRRGNMHTEKLCHNIWQVGFIDVVLLLLIQ